MTPRKKLLEYTESGEWQDEDFSYQNSVEVRENDGLEMVFRCVIIDNEDGDAVYSDLKKDDLDEEVYDNWIDSLDIDEYDFGEVKEDAAGQKPDLRPMESVVTSQTNVTYRRPEFRKDDSSNLWIKGGEVVEGDVDITWDGQMPEGVYENIIGRSTVQDSNLRTEEEWEQALPDNFVRDLPKGSYELYRDLEIENLASVRGKSPVDVYEEFHDGETEEDEYVLISGKNQDLTLANPWSKKIIDAIDSIEVEEIQHLHDGDVDNYESDNLESLIDRFSPAQSETNSIDDNMSEGISERFDTESPESIFEALDSKFDVKSVNGAVISSEDQSTTEILNDPRVKKAT